MVKALWIDDMESELSDWSAAGSGTLAATRRKQLLYILKRARVSGGAVQNALRERAEALLQICREGALREDALAASMSAAHPLRPAMDVAELTARLDGLEVGNSDEFDDVLQQQELNLMEGFAAADNLAQPPGRMPELKAMRYVRTALTEFGAQRRVAQASREIHDESGPLNPQKLVTDSLHLMGQLSPAYLERFIAYSDTLLWLDAAGKSSSKVQ
jgi:hypothetical protein